MTAWPMSGRFFFHDAMMRPRTLVATALFSSFVAGARAADTTAVTRSIP
jgi:hypothetical protein